MYKAVIFDMDGTLINSDEMVLTIYKQLTLKYPPYIPLNLIPKEELLAKSYIEILKKLYPEPYDIYLNEIQNLFLSYNHLVKLFKGTKSLLSFLRKKGYKMGLLTSEMSRIAHVELKQLEIDHYFDVIVTFDDVSNPKPDAEGLLYIIQSLNMNLEDVLYIGDQKSDGITGKNAVVQTGLMAWKKSKLEMGAYFDYTFQSFEDLKYHLIRFDNPFHLSLVNNRGYKILQLTDLHLMDDYKDDKTFHLISEMIKRTSPDFIIYTGDQTMSPKALKLYEALGRFTDQFNIKFSYIFGNHDTDHGVTYDSLNHAISRSKNLVFASCPKKLGYSNMHIEIIDDQGLLQYLVITLDTHIDQYYMFEGKKQWGYSEISPNQIDWYKHLIRYYTYRFKRVIPSIIFLHIPIYEYRDVNQNHPSYQGVFLEGPSAPPVKNGFFETLVELGSTKALFCGHDHYNDYQFKKDGILLAYGRVSGYYEYGEPGFTKGCRIIELNTNAIHSKIELLDD